MVQAPVARRRFGGSGQGHVRRPDRGPAAGVLGAGLGARSRRFLIDRSTRASLAPGQGRDQAVRPALIAAAAALLAAMPAHAEVKQTWAAGFQLEDRTTIAASPDKVWAALGQIGQWWNGEHSYSGDSANMTMPLTPGGCFCEALPKLGPGAGVKHGEVVMVMPGQALRIDAPLGPLQGEGVGAALTFTLKAAPGGGTEVVETFNVGGARPEIVGFAAGIDGVVREQLGRLKSYVETGKPQ